MNLKCAHLALSVFYAWTLQWELMIDAGSRQIIIESLGLVSTLEADHLWEHSKTDGLVFHRRNASGVRGLSAGLRRPLPHPLRCLLPHLYSDPSDQSRTHRNADTWLSSAAEVAEEEFSAVAEIFRVYRKLLLKMARRQYRP